MEFSSDYFSDLIEGAISKIKYPTTAPHLFDPIRYTLEGGGKRLRPTLLLAAFASISEQDPSVAINQALAIEMFHNFTLLHDDIMDRAEIRRGRPTVHIRWNDNAAILSGDTMLSIAYQLLAKAPIDCLPDILEIFNDTALGVYEGQQLDMEFERRNDVSVDEYLEMIKLKTSVLLAGACAIGARRAGADKATTELFYEYGVNLGLAFQLQDDWLDTFGDPAIFGKAIGGDIVNNKKTWLFISALNEANDEILSIIDQKPSDHIKIEAITKIYNSLNLADRCQQLANCYADKAIECLSKINITPEARAYFTALARKATSRTN